MKRADIFIPLKVALRWLRWGRPSIATAATQPATPFKFYVAAHQPDHRVDKRSKRGAIRLTAKQQQLELAINGWNYAVTHKS